MPSTQQDTPAFGQSSEAQQEGRKGQKMKRQKGKETQAQT